jgi:dTDP-4-amino-4,6-dideoxygalactose transaminase
MPERPTFIPIAKPRLGQEEEIAAARAISSGWVTQGPEVAAFEREFAAAVGASYACAVSNCTAALHLALLVLGVRPGDEVITVSHSFIATANSVRYCGARPVFVDIQPGTLNLDPTLVEAVITPRTTALLCVHQLGMPCDLRALFDIARRRSIPIVEDAACAVGSEILWNGAWEKIGKPHGDIACFSLHPRKLLTTGDGGMLTTTNARHDARFRLLRHHGMSIQDTLRHSAAQVMFEEYTDLGFNYRMSDIQAAVGREQLKRLPGNIERRRLLARRYGEQLRDISELGLPAEPDWARSNWQSYYVRLPDGCNQKQLMQDLLDRGIATRRGVMCAHREPAYPVDSWSCGTRREECGCTGRNCRRLAESQRAQETGIMLPLYDALNESDQDRVIGELRWSLARQFQT